jgi:hypothetical protein
LLWAFSKKGIMGDVNDRENCSIHEPGNKVVGWAKVLKSPLRASFQ